MIIKESEQTRLYSSIAPSGNLWLRETKNIAQRSGELAKQRRSVTKGEVGAIYTSSSDRLLRSLDRD